MIFGTRHFTLPVVDEPVIPIARRTHLHTTPHAEHDPDHYLLNYLRVAVAQLTIAAKIWFMCFIKLNRIHCNSTSCERLRFYNYDQLSLRPPAWIELVKYQYRLYRISGNTSRIRKFCDIGNFIFLKASYMWISYNIIVITTFFL